MSPVVDGHVYITASKIEMEGFLKNYGYKDIVRSRILAVLSRLRKGASISIVLDEWSTEPWPGEAEKGYQWKFNVQLSGDLAPNIDRMIASSTTLGNTLRRFVDRYNYKFMFYDETKLHFQGANI